MKTLSPVFSNIIFILALALTACDGGDTGGNSDGTTYTAGKSVAYTVGSGTSAVSFNMHYAPSGSFSSEDDTVNKGTTSPPTTITVSHDYWIARTAVTYELWMSVWNWAKDYSYNFTNFDPADYEPQYPVIFISWRDAVVWCNALTEYYNATSKVSLVCVYTYNGDIVKDAYVDDTVIDWANLTIATTAKGFRLPTSDEWELAARYQNGTNWTPVDHVSGDTSGYCYDFGISSTPSSVFGNYAWWGYEYDGGNCTSTKIVGTAGSLTPNTPCTGNANALGLYDMSGNVWQWCINTYNAPSNLRVFRGGSWRDDRKWLALGWIGYGYSTDGYGFVGLRPVRTQ